MTITLYWIIASIWLMFALIFIGYTGDELGSEFVLPVVFSTLIWPIGLAALLVLGLLEFGKWLRKFK